MSKTFMDTNVILDAFLPDRPSAEAARQILAIGTETDRLYLSSLSMTNLDYVLRKNLGKDRASGILEAIFKRYYILHYQETSKTLSNEKNDLFETDE